MEYRIRRYDGMYRWVVDSGTPRYGSDGSFHGFVGGCLDITEQKEAERMLRSLSHRLMVAQDEERRRIARELHDHLSQQLALLSLDLQQLAIKPVSAREAMAVIQEAWRRTTEIASDVHAISHRLHPSKMEALGLVATAQAHCRDISRQSIPVQFQHADMPSGIQPDRALSVFRVLEEALSNVVRHSGATEAKVSLYRDRHARRPPRRGQWLRIHGDRAAARRPRPDQHARADATPRRHALDYLGAGQRLCRRGAAAARVRPEPARDGGTGLARPARRPGRHQSHQRVTLPDLHS